MANGISPREMAEIDAAILGRQALQQGAPVGVVNNLLSGSGISPATTVPTQTINPVQSPSGLLDIVGDMFRSRPSIESVSDVFNPQGLMNLLPQADTMRGLQQEEAQVGEVVTPADLIPEVRFKGEPVLDIATDAVNEQEEAANAFQKARAGTATPKDMVKITKVQKEQAKAAGVDVPVIEKPEGVDKSFWEQLQKEFDIGTVGMALLATSGNGKGLAANLGLALSAGKQALKDEAALQSTQIDTALDRRKKIAEIRKLAADATKALADATGGAIKDPTATQIGVEGGFLKSLTGEKEVPKDLSDYTARLRQQLVSRGITDKNNQDQFIAERLHADGILDEKFFGGLKTVSAESRLGY